MTKPKKPNENLRLTRPLDDGRVIVSKVSMKVKNNRGRHVEPFSKLWDMARLYRILHEHGGKTKELALDITSRVTKAHEILDTEEARLASKREAKNEVKNEAEALAKIDAIAKAKRRETSIQTHADNIKKHERKYRPKNSPTGKPPKYTVTPGDKNTDFLMLKLVIKKYNWIENAIKENLADELKFLWADNETHKKTTI